MIQIVYYLKNMPYAAPFQTDPCRLAYSRDIKNGNRFNSKNIKGEISPISVERMISMKKTLSALLSVCIAASACTVFPMSASGAELLNATFESGLDGWTARGNASVEVTSATAASGSKAAAVSNRSDSWNGIQYSLDSICTAGESYSFSAMVTQQATPAAVHFKLSLQYSTGGGGMFGGGQNTYASIAEKDSVSGTWIQLANDSYQIPADATNLVLYVETEDSKVDFFVDDIFVGSSGSTPSGPSQPEQPANGKRGDVNGDSSVNKKDVEQLRDYLLGKTSDINGKTADLDGNKTLNAADLSALKGLVMNPPAETTVTTPEPKQETTTTAGGGQPSSGTHVSAKEYMSKMKNDLKTQVPGNVTKGDSGKLEKIQYFSKKANRNKPANVWTPPGYDSSKKYPVMFMNHGVMGNEDNMVSNWGVREMASNLIQSGEAVPFIIVFPQMYTDPSSASPMGINMNVMDNYDTFVYDVRDSLYPYICEHYSVATGRENTAVAGFSMGGRESLYLGMMMPEMFGYVCASSPAPGIVPASDGFIANHLGSKKIDSEQRMTNSDFKFSDSDLPYILMIGGGTNDQVVGTFPKQYHELFDKNGTMNLWMEFPGAGHDAGVGTPLFYNFFRYVFKA